MNIVVLVNERPEGRAALDWALLNGIHLPSVNDDPVVHVVHESTGDSLARPSYISPALTEEITAQLRAAGVKHEIHSTPADPAARVIDLAVDAAAELVVIGMRRRSPTLKLIVGSHAQRIMLDAPCPVVGVKE